MDETREKMIAMSCCIWIIPIILIINLLAYNYLPLIWGIEEENSMWLFINIKKMLAIARINQVPAKKRSPISLWTQGNPNLKDNQSLHHLSSSLLWKKVSSKDPPESQKSQLMSDKPPEGSNLSQNPWTIPLFLRKITM